MGNSVSPSLVEQFGEALKNRLKLEQGYARKLEVVRSNRLEMPRAELKAIHERYDQKMAPASISLQERKTGALLRLELETEEEIQTKLQEKFPSRITLSVSALQGKKYLLPSFNTVRGHEELKALINKWFSLFLDGESI